MGDEDLYFVPTRSSLSGSSSYSCVVHELSRNKSISSKEVSKSSSDNPPITVDSRHDMLQSQRNRNAEMKKLRFEVYKFAKTSMKAKDKFTSDMELAIRLGAERPKRGGKNYVEFKTEVTERKKTIAALKANPSLSVDNSLYDPYKTKFNLTKKARIDRKKGNIGGMLNDYGKAQTRGKFNKNSKR